MNLFFPSKFANVCSLTLDDSLPSVPRVGVPNRVVVEVPGLIDVPNNCAAFHVYDVTEIISE